MAHPEEEEIRAAVAHAVASWALAYPIPSWQLAQGYDADSLAQAWGEGAAVFVMAALQPKDDAHTVAMFKTILRMAAQVERAEAETARLRQVGQVFMEKVDATRAALRELDSAISRYDGDSQLRGLFNKLVRTLGLPEEEEDPRK